MLAILPILRYAVLRDISHKELTAVDKITEKLLRLDLGRIGLKPDQDETYVAIVIKSFLLKYHQEQRVQILTHIMKPKNFRMVVNGEQAHLFVLSAEVRSKALKTLVAQGLEFALAELREDSGEALGESDSNEAFGQSLRQMAAARFQKACRSFDPEKADKAFVSFLFSLYSLVVGEG